MLYTTLNDVCEKATCVESLDKLLAYLGKTEADDEQLSFKTILDAIGLEESVCALRSIDSSEVRPFFVRHLKRVQRAIRAERARRDLLDSEINTAVCTTSGSLESAHESATTAHVNPVALNHVGESVWDEVKEAQKEDFIATFCGED